MGNPELDRALVLLPLVIDGVKATMSTGSRPGYGPRGPDVSTSLKFLSVPLVSAFLYPQLSVPFS